MMELPFSPLSFTHI